MACIIFHLESSKYAVAERKKRFGIHFYRQQHIISLPLNMLEIRANKWVKLGRDDIFGRQPSFCHDQSEVAVSSAPWAFHQQLFKSQRG